MESLQDEELEKVNGGIGKGYANRMNLITRHCPYCKATHEMAKSNETRPVSMQEENIDGYLCGVNNRIFYVENLPPSCGSLKHYHDENGQLIATRTS